VAGFAIGVEPTEPIPETSAAERVVADVLAIGAPVADAERVRDAVPLWFHTFALAPGIYTPGIARDHGYRLAMLGSDRFAGRSVLDVGTFDGFYSFLAEVRGARRVVAVDNEQYVDWVRARFGVRLHGGVGFRAIAGLVASRVEYRRMDALRVHELGERFDVVLCFGILHRVTDPIALLRALAGVLAPGGEIVLETYGSRLAADAPEIEVHEPGDVYARDAFVYWGFSPEGLRRLGRIVGLDEVEVVDELEIDGHPRIVAMLRADRVCDRALRSPLRLPAASRQARDGAPPIDRR
jgi:tRNA (mo5U34)-methyltransferase